MGGVAPDVEDGDSGGEVKLTEYVVTRWWRAPEVRVPTIHGIVLFFAVRRGVPVLERLAVLRPVWPVLLNPFRKQLSKKCSCTGGDPVNERGVRPPFSLKKPFGD